MINFKKILEILIISLLLMWKSMIGVAQNLPKDGYIMLDSLNKNFKVNSYTLYTKELYDIDGKIELYSFDMWGGNILLVLSVLPSFTEKGNWKKVNFDSIKDKILTGSQIRRYATDIYNSKEISSEDINTLKFALVKKADGHYYVSNVCLTERFNVRNYTFPLIATRKKTINIGSPAITIQEFNKKLPQYMTSMNPKNDHSLLLDRGLLENYYLSKKLVIGKDTAYQFWNFTDWQVMDGWNVQRGVDRFIYIPGKGIVGGSYDFWFAFKPWREDYIVKGVPVSREKLWDNIINERIILAEELKN